jgi:hypothetical protein
MELIAVAVAFLLSVRVGVAAARAILEAVFFLMARSAVRYAPAKAAAAEP